MPAKKKNPSAEKRVRQAEKRHERNVAAKSALKTVSKKLTRSVSDKNAEATAGALKEAAKAYARAASKGIIHKNTAARKVSRLAKLAAKTTA